MKQGTSNISKLVAGKVKPDPRDPRVKVASNAQGTNELMTAIKGAK